MLETEKRDDTAERVITAALARLCELGARGALISVDMRDGFIHGSHGGPMAALGLAVAAKDSTLRELAAGTTDARSVANPHAVINGRTLS